MMEMREGVGFPSTCRELLPYTRPVAWHDANGFYRLLGLSPCASDKEIRRAGRCLLRRYHPDGPEPDEERFLCIQEAYRTLTEKREVYDSLPDGYFMVMESNKDIDCIEVARSTDYAGWSYFSEVPRVTDDSVALWAYEHYLEAALALPTTLPVISVVLIQGHGDPWIEDGLIYIPMSDVQGRMVATSEEPQGPTDKADKGHVTTH